MCATKRIATLNGFVSTLYSIPILHVYVQIFKGCYFHGCLVVHKHFIIENQD